MEKLIQITSGRGPLECQWVVAKVLKTFLEEAKQNTIEYEIIHRENGDENLTLKSVTILLQSKDLQEFLSKNYNKNSTIVVDPTFLLTANKWSAMAEKPKANKKYVLVYSVDLRNDALRIAQNIAKEIQAEVIELSMNVDKNGLKNKYQTASPEAYVGLFENAAFVVTSSFHGTAFSVIFNKPFYSIAHGSDKDSWQKTILNNLGVLDRFIAKDSNPSFKTLDYTIPNQKLNDLRESSIQFLEKSLKR
mgnify:CR=1 FL=1